ncbi:MAG: M48 family metallopeptidase [Candidatus Micrarchaeia archaeon]
MESIKVKGVDLTIEMKLKDTKNATARLRNGVILVTLPVRLGEEHRKEIYEKLKSRMIRRIEKRGISEFQSGGIEIKDGQSISAMGRSFTVSIRHCNNKRYSGARVRGNEIEIRLASVVGKELEGRVASMLAIKAISRALQMSIEKRVRELNAAHFKAQINRVRIRDNTTLWGSYSMKSGNISINFKLLLAPSDMLDYVIIHELAHTRVHNHSRRFWALVAGAMPNYMEKRRWLRRNGGLLGMAASAGASAAGAGPKCLGGPENTVEHSKI